MRIQQIRAGALLLVCALFLGGCGGGGPVAAKSRAKTIVRMWAFPLLPELRDEEVYDTLRARFRQEHPEIEVQVELLPWAGRMQKMLTAVAGGHSPDAVYLNLDFLQRFVALGVLRPVDKYFPEADRAEYDPGVIDAVTFQEHTWLFPMLRTVTVGVYNKELFEKGGLDPEKPPRTWQELDATARKLTCDVNGDGQTDQWGLGYVFGGDTVNMTFWPLLWQAGGDVLASNGTTAAFAGAEGVEALTYITKLYRDGCIPKSYMGIGGSEFASGKLGYWLGVGMLEVSQIRRDAPHLKIGIGPVLENKKRLSYSSIGSFGIFAASKHPDEAATWLRFLTRADNMREFCRAVNYVPAKKSVGSIYGDDPIYRAMEAETAFCRTDPKSPFARQIMMAVSPKLQEAALGRKSPADALKEAEIAANAILGRGN